MRDEAGVAGIGFAGGATPVRARDAERTRAWRRFLRNRLSMVGLGVVLVFLAVAALAPYLVPYPADVTGAVQTADRLRPPSRAHVMGTDEVGRDVFTRLLAGTRVSLAIGVIIIAVAMSIGIPLGLVAGFTGGWVEDVVMRLTDVFLAVPGIVLAITIVTVLGPGILHAMFAISLVWWPGYARMVHGRAVALRGRAFVEAARGLGASPARILLRHVLPNLLTVIVIKGSMDMGLAILTAASLGFVGVGAQPPTPEWGEMISTGQPYLPTWWWLSVFPGAAIVVTVLGFNLLGDGLRDLLDPTGLA
jgi:peptide/nickel transport system permease protein